MIDLPTVIHIAANDVHRRFRGYVDREDLVQEGWLWTTLHKFRVEKFNEDENERNASYQIRTELARYMERYARREKAARLGYDTEDEYRYGKAQVETLLSSVLTDDYLPAAMGLEQTRVNTDPAEGNNFTVMRADVAQAWERADLTDLDRDMVYMRYKDGLTDSEIGAPLGMSRQAVNARLNRITRAIVRELGGDAPKDCPYDCECHEAKLRLRPGCRSELSGANQLST